MRLSLHLSAADTLPFVLVLDDIVVLGSNLQVASLAHHLAAPRHQHLGLFIRLTIRRQLTKT